LVVEVFIFLNLVVPVRESAVVLVIADVAPTTGFADIASQLLAVLAFDAGTAVRAEAALVANVVSRSAGVTLLVVLDHRSPSAGEVSARPWE
jgi:hypothetical protein